MKLLKHSWFVKFGSVFLLQLILISYVHSQCASGYTSGDLTISSTCTISSNITITGNLILNSGAQLNISPGVIVTVNGHLATGYKVGVVNISGGTLDIGTYLHNEDQTTLNISGTTINTGTYFLNDYKSIMSVTNSIVNVGTYLHNEDQTILTIDNSVFVVEGYVYNDYKASFSLENGSDMTINGNPDIGGYALHNDDQTDFIVDGSSLTVNGDVWNDYKGNMEVNNGGSMYVDGDYRNEDQATLSISDGGLQVTGDFINDWKADVNVEDGGQMLVEGDLINDSSSTIDVADGGAFCAEGTSSNPGSITAISGDTDCSDGCCGASVTLPVTLLYFSSESQQSKVILTWATATEINNDYFTIEKSTDGITYIEVDRVDGHGNSEEEITYSWYDFSHASQTVYYRLKQTDFDGQFEYLGLVSVQPGKVEDISISPNPVDHGQSIAVKGDLREASSYVIRDLMGRAVDSGKFLFNHLVSTRELTPGIYIITIQSNSDSFSEKLIVR